LVGPNASGKTTFLDVIAFLGDVLREGPQKAVEKRCRSLKELVWMGEGDAFELAVEMVPPESVLNGKHREYRRCRYEVCVGVSHHGGGVRLLGENFWLLKASSEVQKPQQRSLFPMEHEPAGPVVRPSRKQTPPGWRKVVSLREEGQAYFRSETTDWNFPLRPGWERAALSMVPDEAERFPISTWARALLTRGVQVLILNSLLMRWPCRPDMPDTFQPDGSNLPLAVRRLREHQPDRFRRWLRHIQTILPDVQDIEVKEREEDRYLYLVVRSGEVRIPSWLLSDGTLRLLALTLLAYLPSENAIYLIEEPENGIHPRAIEGVFQSLSSVYEGQVLLATHSALLLGLAKPEHILCFARTERQATDIVRGDEHPALREWRDVWVWSKDQAVASALDLSLSDLEDLLKDGKPSSPKETLERVLWERRIPRSSSLYEDIASKVDFTRCTDPAFRLLWETLRRWFGPKDTQFPQEVQCPEP
ncbi:MAG: ATP-binding protein, partial [Anaerolineae bacterium]|nr:ATP-binding protein [Anaerolineae bacterium]